jgi:uncharacterized protein YozE (UPF0346 family)
VIYYKLAKEVHVPHDEEKLDNSTLSQKSSRWRISLSTMKQLDIIEHDVRPASYHMPNLLLEDPLSSSICLFEQGVTKWDWKEKSRYFPIIETNQLALCRRRRHYKRKIQLNVTVMNKLAVLLQPQQQSNNNEMIKELRRHRTSKVRNTVTTLANKVVNNITFLPQKNLKDFKIIQNSLKTNQRKKNRLCELDHSRFKF